MDAAVQAQATVNIELRVAMAAPFIPGLTATHMRILGYLDAGKSREEIERLEDMKTGFYSGYMRDMAAKLQLDDLPTSFQPEHLRAIMVEAYRLARDKGGGRTLESRLSLERMPQNERALLEGLIQTGSLSGLRASLKMNRQVFGRSLESLMHRLDVKHIRNPATRIKAMVEKGSRMLNEVGEPVDARKPASFNNVDAMTARGVAAPSGISARKGSGMNDPANASGSEVPSEDAALRALSESRLNSLVRSIAGLSDSRRAVLSGVLRRLRDETIADEAGLSVATVRQYRYTNFSKLGLSEMEKEERLKFVAEAHQRYVAKTYQKAGVLPQPSQSAAEQQKAASVAQKAAAPLLKPDLYGPGVVVTPPEGASLVMTVSAVFYAGAAPESYETRVNELRRQGYVTWKFVTFPCLTDPAKSIGHLVLIKKDQP